MVGRSWMVAGRTVVAMLLSLLVIATNVILWWVLVVFVFFGLSDCSGVGWAINCSMTTADKVVAVAVAVLLVAPFGWVMLRTVRRLGRWASADH